MIDMHGWMAAAQHAASAAEVLEYRLATIADGSLVVLPSCGAGRVCMLIIACTCHGQPLTLCSTTPDTAMVLARCRSG
jgi:hypothetical protein